MRLGLFMRFLLEDYKWLQCSKLLGGAFCLSCADFGSQIGVNSSKLEKLVVGPFTSLVLFRH